MITMMGFFAVYAGLIYNDFFSVPLNLFGSSWYWDHHEGDEHHDDEGEGHSETTASPGCVGFRLCWLSDEAGSAAPVVKKQRFVLTWDSAPRR